MKTLIEIGSVSRSFGNLKALEQVTLNVAEGETVALLGHNGAGKTTLFRILLGFIQADIGEVRIAGHDAGSEAARMTISYLPETVAFPKTLSGQEIVRFYASLKGASKQEADKALESVGLGEAADRRCGTYSKGMRQRLGLAQAIVGRPRILLLDEPTSGLDPISRSDFYALIAEMADQGTSVLLSSHGLSELEARAGRMAILRRGRLVADGSLAALQKNARLPTRIRIRASAPGAEDFHRRFGGRRINGASVEITCAADEKMPLLSEIHDRSPALEDIEVITPSLDEIYRFYSRTEIAVEADG